MAAQFRWALFASPPAPAFGTGAALARPLLQAPHNVRLDGMLSRSSTGAQVLYPSSVGSWDPFAMAEDVVTAAFE